MIDLTSFLGALATYLANAAGLQYASTPRDLWFPQADEVSGGACSAVFSVLRPVSGSLPWTPVVKAQIQFMTIAPKTRDKDGLNRAQTLFNALLDSSGRPGRMVTILAPAAGVAGWRANSIDPQVPAMVRRDENGRAVWVSNVDFRIVQLPAL